MAQGSWLQLSVPGSKAWSRSPLALAPQEGLGFRCHLLGSSGFNGFKLEKAGIWDSRSDLDQLHLV